MQTSSGAPSRSPTPRFPQAYSQQFFDGSGFRTQVTPLKDAVLGDLSRNLWIIFGAVGLLLLLACANVANLFIVRLESRRGELAIRSALGAGRADIARHLLAEGLTLSVTGGALALLLGFWAIPVMVTMAPESLPRLDVVGMDAGTIGFIAVLSLLVGILLAAYPLIRHSTVLSGSIMGSGARIAGAGRGQQRLRSSLVVAQIALALVLLDGAGLLMQSLRSLSAVDPGVNPEGVLAVDLFLTPSRNTSDVDIWRTYRQVLESVDGIPGVIASGMTSELPVEGGFGCTVQGLEDAVVREHLATIGLSACAGQEPTAPGYFAAMGIDVLRGRTFTNADNDDPTRGSVVVSQAFADRFWPDQDPIGKGVAPSGRTTTPFYRVIGVVDNVPARALDGDPAIAIYYPIVHNPGSPGNWDWWRPTSMSLVIRSGLADPVSLLPEVRRAIQAVDAGIPIANARSMDGIIAASMARLTFTFILLGIAAAVAVVLAAVGLYGVLAYVVRRRTREIGLRMAIGAPAAQVERLFVRRSLPLVGVGLMAGTMLALATTRVMEGLLIGVEPTNPVAFASAVGVLSVVALLASWQPARRAARVDPVQALRVE